MFLFLLLLLARFPPTIEHLCLRSLPPRQIRPHFFKFSVVCHHSVSDSALMAGAIHSGCCGSKVREEKCHELIRLRGWRCLCSGGGAVGGSLGSSLDPSSLFAPQADKGLFHVQEPSGKENPTLWWNGSTIVTGRPCTASVDSACLCFKGP